MLPDSDHAPVSFWAMQPESSSERTSSLVKNGFPSLASNSCWARPSTISLPPISVSRNARCSSSENGSSAMDSNCRSPRNEDSILVKRMPAVGLGRAKGSHDQRWRRRQSSHDVLQGFDRYVGPVQILQKQQQAVCRRPGGSACVPIVRRSAFGFPASESRRSGSSASCRRRPNGSARARPASGTTPTVRRRGPTCRAVRWTDCPIPSAGSNPGSPRKTRNKETPLPVR